MQWDIHHLRGFAAWGVKSGNPISYYNGSRWTFSWQNGRQLASANKTGTAISYTYDQNGLRTSKTVDGIRHDYVYASGRLLRETYGNVTLDFSYGINGTPYSLTYTNGSNAPVTYYYITNLQNDVMYMVNASGTKVAEYEFLHSNRASNHTVRFCSGKREIQRSGISCAFPAAQPEASIS